MCRLLFVRSPRALDPRPHLSRFARTAQISPEDQSHGWGCAWRLRDQWNFYHSLKPVWEDSYEHVPQTTFLLAHARSAFRNEGIEIKNNMPFTDGSKVFIFNGELQGVRIREKGRIGAEKVFNFVKRYDDGDTLNAIRTGVKLLRQKSNYVRAMNFIIAERDRAWLNSEYSENSEYFQMHEKIVGDVHTISSSPYEGESDWIGISNHAAGEIIHHV